MRPHLEDDGVHLQARELVEDRTCFGLLGGGAQAFRGRPVDVVNRRHPRGAELAGDGWRVVTDGDVVLRGERRRLEKTE